MSTNYEEIDAPHGEKMIEITIRYWTDGIANEEGKLVPKHYHDYGVVRMTTNKSHGIPSRKSIPFNSSTELLEKIKELHEHHKTVAYHH